MKRKIIRIDEEKCTGCEECIPNCPEGAIQIIDGKARLVSDIMCDGLGACLGHCPEDAISIEEREAEEYDEKKVMKNIVKAGTNTIKAHLDHLRDHNQNEYYQQAIDFLKKNNIKIPAEKKEPVMQPHAHNGCPGAKMMSFNKKQETGEPAGGRRLSQLTHWPIQMHLISPAAPHYKGADLLFAADCVPFALGDFHKDYLKDKALAIACPKLDSGQDIYIEKLTALINEAGINTLTVMTMQVPCCAGLLHLAKEAASKAKRKIPIKHIVASLQGEILKQEWV